MPDLAVAYSATTWIRILAIGAKDLDFECMGDTIDMVSA